MILKKNFIWYGTIWKKNMDLIQYGTGTCLLPLEVELIHLRTWTP
jgi:hypothetical protein